MTGAGHGTRFTERNPIQLINSSIPSCRKVLGSCQVGSTRHARHRSKALLKVIFICPVHMMLQVDTNDGSALDPSSSKTTIFHVISPLDDGHATVWPHARLRTPIPNQKTTDIGAGYAKGRQNLQPTSARASRQHRCLLPLTHEGEPSSSDPNLRCHEPICSSRK